MKPEIESDVGCIVIEYVTSIMVITMLHVILSIQ